MVEKTSFFYNFMSFLFLRTEKACSDCREEKLSLNWKKPSAEPCSVLAAICYDRLEDRAETQKDQKN